MMGGFVVANFYPFGDWCQKAAVPLECYTDVPACDLPFVVGERYPISWTTKSGVWRTVGQPRSIFVPGVPLDLPGTCWQIGESSVFMEIAHELLVD